MYKFVLNLFIYDNYISFLPASVAPNSLKHICAYVWFGLCEWKIATADPILVIILTL